MPGFCTLSNSSQDVVFPRATGAAEALVAKHQSEQPLKFYTSWFCPFAQRVWMILEEKQIPYQYIEVNPYEKPKALTNLNPHRMVPTIQHQENPLYDSLIISEFLEDAYPDHGPRLVPSDPYTKARMKLWINFATSKIIPYWQMSLQLQPHPDENIYAQAKEMLRLPFLNNLKEFVSEMSSGGPYFLGSELSLADFVLVPWGINMWVFTEFKDWMAIPPKSQGGEDEVTWERWRLWIDAMSARPSVQETMSKKEHYVPIYKRLAEELAEIQEEAEKAAKDLHHLP